MKCDKCKSKKSMNLTNANFNGSIRTVYLCNSCGAIKDIEGEFCNGIEQESN